MPIKPENRGKYPKDWPAIRARILNRAGNKCEWCGVENHAEGVRDAKGRFCPMTVGEADAASMDGEKVVRIILTIAHVHNPDPADCRDENLAALCQRCHNRHDAPMRLRNRRLAKMRNQLFGGEENEVRQAPEIPD
jgi:hypothetical protein